MERAFFICSGRSDRGADGIMFLIIYLFSSAFLRDMPFAALYFSAYEGLKATQAKHFVRNNLSTREEKEDRLKMIHHLVAGACAGAIASLCTLPFDVVKTRLQVFCYGGIH